MGRRYWGISEWTGRQGGDVTMTITITAFERSPNGGKGLARDGAFSARD